MRRLVAAGLLLAALAAAQPGPPPAPDAATSAPQQAFSGQLSLGYGEFLAPGATRDLECALDAVPPQWRLNFAAIDLQRHPGGCARCVSAVRFIG